MSIQRIRLGDGFKGEKLPTMDLPIDVQTQSIAILGIRGSGKTNTAVVLAEELHGAGLRFCVADPVGVWWGLRAGPDGKGGGLPVVVMGGEHGDVPLEVGAGEIVADFVSTSAESVILDLSLFRKGETTRFMTAFAERLYHRNRDPLHLILDEADAFAPQRPFGDQARLLGAVEDLVRRGRARGIGITLISQRAAVLNKDVLTQAEVLIAHRTIGPQDRKAIEAWTEVHGTPKERATLLESLAGLDTGTAWFWSPSWRRLFQKVHVRARETFDSSATPKAGRRRESPRELAPIDLDVLRKKMAETVERAKANDPKELRRRIGELEGELRARNARPVQAEKGPVSILKEEHVASLHEAVEAFGDCAAAARDDAKAVTEAAAGLERLGRDILAAVANARHGQKDPFVALHPREPGDGGAHVRFTSSRKAFTPIQVPPGELGVTPAQGRIMDALAGLEGLGEMAPEKVQVALHAGASPKSSTYANNLGALRTAGLIEYPAPGVVQLTEKGRSMAGGPRRPPSAEVLHEALRDRLPAAQWKIVAALIERRGQVLQRIHLATEVGAGADSSTFANNLGALRSMGLIKYPTPGSVTAAPMLFIEGGR